MTAQHHHDPEPRIGSTSAREQHTQTVLAIIGTLISAGILASVGLMVRTSERVIESTTRFEEQIKQSSRTLDDVASRLERIDATLANHETRITVQERRDAETARAAETPRRRPGNGGGQP